MDKKINPSPITYLNSGVDIDAGNTLVEAIKPHAKRTITRGSRAELGGFGGFFDLRDIGFSDLSLIHI